jgi:hypothetical protein
LNEEAIIKGKEKNIEEVHDEVDLCKWVVLGIHPTLGPQVTT